MLFIILMTLAIIQLGKTVEVNEKTLPMSFICEDEKIIDMDHRLRLIELMNQNMQLSINQQLQEIKTAIAGITIPKDDINRQLQEIKTVIAGITISKDDINWQFKEIKTAIAGITIHKNEDKQCECNAICKDLAISSTTADICNTTVGETINPNSITTVVSSTVSGSAIIPAVIPEFCQSDLSGIQIIQIPSSKLDPFLVNCIQDSKQGDDPWILIQRRRDGSVDFYRNWTDYQQGFGNLEGEFFIGLDKLHALTQSARYELWIQMEDFSNETRWARYSSFAIGDESVSYSINTLGNFTGNAGDSLTYHSGSKFSTKDKDNDRDSGNCAVYKRSAWWFKNCSLSNLNGYYYSSLSEAKKHTNIHWASWEDYDHLLKYVHMAIRPVK